MLDVMRLIQHEQRPWAKFAQPIAHARYITDCAVRPSLLSELHWWASQRSLDRLPDRRATAL